ncbi:MAG: Crp/Fnr family transcriptional regulator [Hyphomicrobiales bacterium]|nr:Crp/Fnr family transcriptional regulator [Hyphomicrobiales bacterium]
MLTTSEPAAPLAKPLRIAAKTQTARSPHGALFDRIPHVSSRVLAAKEHLFRSGDAATHVYRVECGHFCIYRLLPDGRRQVMGFASAGDVIGLGATGDYDCTAQATETSRVASMPVSVLREVARRDAAVGAMLCEAMAEELAAARDVLVMVSHRSASEKLADFLLALSRRNARRGADPDVIVLPMTRIDIADFLGLTIETVSRTFTRFRAEGLIGIEQCILVTIQDHAGLARLAGGAGTTGGHTLQRLAS